MPCGKLKMFRHLFQWYRAWLARKTSRRDGREVDFLGCAESLKLFLDDDSQLIVFSAIPRCLKFFTLIFQLQKWTATFLGAVDLAVMNIPTNR